MDGSEMPAVARSEVWFVKVTFTAGRYYWFWAESVDVLETKHVFRNSQILAPGSEGLRIKKLGAEGVVEVEKNDKVKLTYETRLPAPLWFQFEAKGA